MSKTYLEKLRHPKMKVCGKCKKRKEILEFHKNKTTNDGLECYCKICKREDVNKRKIKYYDKYKILNNKSTNKYRKKNLNKKRKQILLNYHLKKGNIKKEPCSKCGELNVEAHHYNYDKFDNILWLCRIHHNEIHSEMIGG